MDPTTLCLIGLAAILLLVFSGAALLWQVAQGRFWLDGKWRQAHPFPTGGLVKSEGLAIIDDGCSRIPMAAHQGWLDRQAASSTTRPDTPPPSSPPPPKPPPTGTAIRPAPPQVQVIGMAEDQPLAQLVLDYGEVLVVHFEGVWELSREADPDCPEVSGDTLPEAIRRARQSWPVPGGEQ